MKIQLINTTNSQKFFKLCQQYGLIHDASSNFALIQTNQRIELRKLDEEKLGAIAIDFVSSILTYRRKFGGGKNEFIAKAVGIKANYKPTILDATAGLGRDAFILSNLGCVVYLVERNPIVKILLIDGLSRAYQDPEIGFFMQQRMKLLEINTIHDIQNLDVDVVYLDPMYPHKNKSALVKKEMQILQLLVGQDLDINVFFMQALTLAKKKVVIKRPKYAGFINQNKPNYSQLSKNHRFDIYLT